MAKINVLEPSVYNLISAGEVVECPASVVKELVENSIDAGACEITVSVVGGGLKKIVVADNGCGIDRDDLTRAFLPHATSKLSKADDLDDIATLGFRGEALASIAAVSQVTFASRTADCEIGNYICVQGGKITDSGQIGMNYGSKITVDHLFFNTPVRAKFLKKPKSEEAAVTAAIARLILANPQIKFKYSCDDAIVYQTNGGAEEGLFAVYKPENVNLMIPFDSVYGSCRVYGYIGKRELSKHNRNYQTIIVNGRSITNAAIQTAVSQAYGSSMMKRCYPVFAIHLILPFDQVDVNVHPNKNEVRFSDPNKVFGCVFKAVSSALASCDKSILWNSQSQAREEKGNDTISEASQAIERETKKQDESPSAAPVCDSVPSQSENFTSVAVSESSVLKNAVSEPRIDARTAHADALQRELLRKQAERISELQAAYRSSDRSDVARINDSAASFVPHSGAKSESEKDAIAQNSVQSTLFDIIEDDLSQDNFRIIGQIFDTYLIVSSGANVYLIDQHACHERILYDEMQEQIDRRAVEIQPLLLPYLLDCNGAQYDFILSIKDTLTQLGFEIEEFDGLSFRVSAVPALLSEINLKTFFDTMLYERQTLSGKSAQLIQEKLAQHACKSAIKGGERLSDAQIRAMLTMTRDGIPLQCPHGRPAVLTFTRKDLDKLFKRIV